MLELLKEILRYQENKEFDGCLSRERFKSKSFSVGGGLLESVRLKGLSKYVFNKFEEQYFQKDFYTSKRLYSDDNEFIGWSVTRLPSKKTSDSTFDASHGDTGIDLGVDEETIFDKSQPRERFVSTNGYCTCQFFCSWGIACRHVIYVSFIEQCGEGNDANSFTPTVLGGSVSAYWLSKSAALTTSISIPSSQVALPSISSSSKKSSKGLSLFLNLSNSENINNLTAADRRRIMMQKLIPIVDASQHSHSKFVAVLEVIRALELSPNYTETTVFSATRASGSASSSALNQASSSATPAPFVSVSSAVCNTASTAISAFSAFSCAPSSTILNDTATSGSTSNTASLTALITAATSVSSAASSSASSVGLDAASSSGSAFNIPATRASMSAAINTPISAESVSENWITCVANPEKCVNKAGRPRKHGPKRGLSKLDIVRGVTMPNKKQKVVAPKAIASKAIKTTQSKAKTRERK
jgi:hypothetical protein